MERILLKIDGMACGMCEAHINDAIRRAFPVKKVRSSHSRGITEIVTERSIDAAALRQVIEETGYRVLSEETQPWEKKGFFRK